MEYMVTRKGFAKVLFTTPSYDKAMNFIHSEVAKQVVTPIDYTESANDRYEEYDYMLDQYELIFG